MSTTFHNDRNERYNHVKISALQKPKIAKLEDGSLSVTCYVFDDTVRRLQRILGHRSLAVSKLILQPCEAASHLYEQLSNIITCLRSYPSIQSLQIEFKSNEDYGRHHYSNHYNEWDVNLAGAFKTLEGISTITALTIDNWRCYEENLLTLQELINKIPYRVLKLDMHSCIGVIEFQKFSETALANFEYLYFHGVDIKIDTKSMYNMRALRVLHLSGDNYLHYFNDKKLAIGFNCLPPQLECLIINGDYLISAELATNISKISIVRLAQVEFADGACEILLTQPENCCARYLDIHSSEINNMTAEAFLKMMQANTALMALGVNTDDLQYTQIAANPRLDQSKKQFIAILEEASKQQLSPALAALITEYVPQQPVNLAIQNHLTDNKKNFKELIDEATLKQLPLELVTIIFAYAIADQQFLIPFGVDPYYLILRRAVDHTNIMPTKKTSSSLATSSISSTSSSFFASTTELCPISSSSSTTTQNVAPQHSNVTNSIFVKQTTTVTTAPQTEGYSDECNSKPKQSVPIASNISI